MTVEHLPVTVMATVEGPPAITIYCQGKRVSAYRDAADGKYYCSCCAAGPLKVSW